MSIFRRRTVDGGKCGQLGPFSLLLLMLVLVLTPLAGAGCETQVVEPPKAPPEDPSLPPPRLDLPAPPHITRPSTPQAYPDGTVSVHGLRLNPQTYLDREVRVRGIVTEVYSCPWADEEEKWHKAEERARRANLPIPPRTHPPCKEPYFFLADTPSSRHKLLVVGFDPEDEKQKPPAKGEQVVLSGSFVKESAIGFMSPEGLLLLRSWEPVGAP